MFSEKEIARAETKIVKVGRGDNLMGVLLKSGTDKEMASLNISRHSFHGEWNYIISPHQK